MKLILTLFIWSLILSCGNESEDSGELTAVSEANETNFKNINNNDDLAKLEDETLCLDKCKTSNISNLSFVDRAKLLSSLDCAIYDFDIFNIDVGFRIFYRANCGTGSQIYYRDISYDGSVQLEAQLISQYCSSKFHQVIEFEAVKSDHGSLIVFTCYKDQRTSTSYSLHINNNNELGDLNVIQENNFSYNRSIKAHKSNFKGSWNESSEFYGVATAAKFLKLDKNGYRVGGDVTINKSQYDVKSMKTVYGDWIMLQHNSYETLCSKVNSNGNGECDSKKLNINNATLIGREYLLGFNHSQSNLLYTSFNSDLCTSGEEHTLGTVKEKYISKLYNHVNINEHYVALLIKVDDRTLSLAVINTEGSFKLENQISVVSSPKIPNAKILKLEDRLVIHYLDDDKLYQLSTMLNN